MQIIFNFCDPAPVIKINPADVIIVGSINLSRKEYMAQLVHGHKGRLGVCDWSFKHNHCCNFSRVPKPDAYKNKDKKHIARMKRVQAYMGWTPEPEAE